MLCYDYVGKETKAFSTFRMVLMLNSMETKGLFRFGCVLFFLLIVAIGTAQGVKIGNPPGQPHASSVMELADSSRGLLVPRLTTAQRNAIANPADGLIVFNLSTGCLNVYFQGFWSAGLCPPSLATVQTDSAVFSSISSHQAYGTVIGDGGLPVAARGFCFNTQPLPDTSHFVVNCGSSTGNFTGVLSGLASNQTYYVRAFAVNGIGVAYGNALIFTTPQLGSIQLPAVSCKRIYDSGQMQNGLYYLDVDSTGPMQAFQTYCDMVNDGGGWTLLLNRTAGHQTIQKTSIDSTGVGSGYLPAAAVQVISQASNQVRLRTGSVFPGFDHAVVSNTTAAILALRNNQNWNQTGASGNAWTVVSGSWCWTANCSPSGASSWPNMYHSCGLANCVHWLSGDCFSRTSGGCSSAEDVNTVWVR